MLKMRIAESDDMKGSVEMAASRSLVLNSTARAGSWNLNLNCSSPLCMSHSRADASPEAVSSRELSSAG